jgi:hypothetical protein
MLRRTVWALLVVLIYGNSLLAADQKGTFQAIDVSRETLTIRIAGKDTTFKVAKGAHFYDQFGKEIGDGIRGAQRFLKKDQAVVVTTQRTDAGEISASRLKVEK